MALPATQRARRPQSARFASAHGSADPPGAGPTSAGFSRLTVVIAMQQHQTLAFAGSASPTAQQRRFQLARRRVGGSQADDQDMVGLAQTALAPGGGGGVSLIDEMPILALLLAEPGHQLGVGSLIACTVRLGTARFAQILIRPLLKCQVKPMRRQRLYNWHVNSVSRISLLTGTMATVSKALTPGFSPANWRVRLSMIDR